MSSGQVVKLSEINPPENSRKYSSIYNNDSIGSGHGQSMLDSPVDWAALSNNKDQWMTIDAG
jgi:hypothetical protein